jgi:hypothetical protein
MAAVIEAAGDARRLTKIDWIDEASLAQAGEPHQPFRQSAISYTCLVVSRRSLVPFLASRRRHSDRANRRHGNGETIATGHLRAAGLGETEERARLELVAGRGSIRKA